MFPVKCRSHMRCAFFPCWMLLVATSCSCVSLYELLQAALCFISCWMQLVANSFSCAALYRAALRFIELRCSLLRCFLLVILHKSYHSFTHKLCCASKNTIRVFAIWVTLALYNQSQMICLICDPSELSAYAHTIRWVIFKSIIIDRWRHNYKKIGIGCIQKRRLCLRFLPSFLPSIPNGLCSTIAIFFGKLHNLQLESSFVQHMLSFFDSSYFYITRYRV